MRRFICMMLALILCMALPMAAFAATGSGPNTPTYVPDGNPKTGDMAMMELWVPMMIVSALALAAVMVVYFKKFRKAN